MMIFATQFLHATLTDTLQLLIGMTSTNYNDANDNDDNESEEHDDIEYDEMIDDAIEFNETHGESNSNDIEMYAGDDYVYGEEDDEDSAVCSPGVNDSRSELSAEFAVHQ